MARRIIVEQRNKGCLSSCLTFLVVLFIIAILIVTLAYIGCIAAGIGLWFLIRYIWRSLVLERPDSGFVKWGMSRSSITRKVLAGALCAIVSICLIAAVSSTSQTNGNTPSDEGASTQEYPESVNDDRDSSKGDTNSSPDSENASPQARITNSSDASVEFVSADENGITLEFSPKDDDENVLIVPNSFDVGGSTHYVLGQDGELNPRVHFALDGKDVGMLDLKAGGSEQVTVSVDGVSDYTDFTMHLDDTTYKDQGRAWTFEDLKVSVKLQ